ncbi:MAG TPA: nickel-dependent lactate racemase [Methanofastidiosum sp.]|jgi:nickel-dependent lactate racemase|nr:MAG: hypothetical protein BWX72_00268 [Firmicutes bacterium ADurb.Bin080]HNZ87987.1 nickel-dependent lactate racemase [Methanofastidiosum sp.]HOC78354.1 nickel-dependent lactate racemase [Methanofastidiosum sp.]HOR87238.1 nickel-dependent lactate racemase [Methanofastidiosum sp.]HPL00075.1 nickel-dependent lactate racemase [Methanofastidiosum sp.]
MRIYLPYKKDKLMVEIPDKNILGIVEPKEVKGSAKENVLKKAVENPTKAMSLSNFLRKHNKILFLINDGQRPTPTKKILDTIYPIMKPYMNKIEFMIATGSHRVPTEEEFNNIFGPYYPEFKPKISIHDSRNDQVLEYIGKTSRGTELYINKKVLESDAIVTIGSSEPHYFAGYTGTRKSFLPGVSSIKTITANHKHALHPNSKTLSLKGNPVHDDMEDAVREIMKLKPNVFAINVVADGEGNIFDAQAGDILEILYKSAKAVDELFCVPVPGKADIIISVAPYPMDVSLYQSQKAIENTKLALKDGGILILVSSCRDGIGDKTFYDLLKDNDTPEEVIKATEKNYILGYHKAAKIAELVTCGQIWAITDLEDKILEQIFIVPHNSLQDSINKALSEKGKDAKVLIFLDGSSTVPLVQ